MSMNSTTSDAEAQQILDDVVASGQEAAFAPEWDRAQVESYTTWTAQDHPELDCHCDRPKASGFRLVPPP